MNQTSSMFGSVLALVNFNWELLPYVVIRHQKTTWWTGMTFKVALRVGIGNESWHQVGTGTDIYCLTGTI